MATGGGTTIALSTSGFNADIISIGHTGLDIPSVPSSHLGTSTNATFDPGDLIDWGSIELGFRVDPANTASKLPTVNGTTKQSMTITTVSSKSITGTVFLTSADLFGMVNNEQQEGTMTLKIDGALTFSAT